MPRIIFIGEPAQGIPGGPIWESGESRDLSDQEAAPYLRNANWRIAGDQAQPAPTPDPAPVEAPPDPAPAAPQEG